ncbi:MAG: DUF433 domain-containing protein [Isosphaeraceae bacterium]
MPRMTNDFDAGAVVFGPKLSLTAQRRADVLHDESGRGFTAFAETIRRELGPGNVLEGVLVDRIILSAWDLQTVSKAIMSGSGLNSVDRRDEARAERSLIRALDALSGLRAGALSQWGRPAPLVLTGPILEDNDDPIPAAEFIDDRPWYSRDEAEIDREEPLDQPSSPDPSHLWVGRLVFEPGVSTRSPVVRGTWITVAHIVSLIVDGWSWADILRSHPELAEADIRACLTYAVEEENASLPIDS